MEADIEVLKIMGDIDKGHFRQWSTQREEGIFGHAGDILS